ncbi:DUF6152 family protein [Croceibacterium aestuarii]|uniref:DUF6152 family protein n=1 Tax=Croceibacterium aestuarii TaxID=3064139 RepID=UPI00272E3026|nr:DUF6152 family protein [Croceibacterium sp. D39]
MNHLTRIAAISAAALGLAGGSAALAHHSFAAEFDRNKPIKLEGSVVKFEWVNPHSWIHIKTANGQTWRVEGGAPSALLRRGWNRNSLPAGTKIIVQAFQARDGDTRASAAEISFPDGRELSLGNPTTEAVAAAAKRAEGN